MNQTKEISFGNRRCLVTGAGGFIGSHLCEELTKTGANVRALVRYTSSESHGMLAHLTPGVHSSLEVVVGDIRDHLSVRKAVRGCQVVFHLAALIGIPYSYHAPISYVDTNISGTLNVLQACLDEGVERMIHTSTSEVYGTARYTPIDEKHPLQGQSPYAATKIAGDKLAESYYLSFNLPVVTIRPFNCFGPRQSARAFIPAMISQILRGDNIRCGSLSPFRDYTYVHDTVAAFIASGTEEKIEGNTINVGCGKKISMGDLLHYIMSRMSSFKPVEQSSQRLRPEKSEVLELVCDNSLAREVLGWRPRYSLGEGLDETITYVQRHPELYPGSRYVV